MLSQTRQQLAVTGLAEYDLLGMGREYFVSFPLCNACINCKPLYGAPAKAVALHGSGHPLEDVFLTLCGGVLGRFRRSRRRRCAAGMVANHNRNCNFNELSQF